MLRFSNKVLAVIAAMAIVAMAAQMAVAQNERPRGRGGRGGGPGGPGGMMGPVPMARLATDEKVQEALKLSSEQKDKIKTINEETREAMDAQRKELDNGGRPDREKMRKVMDEASDKLNKVLDESQQKRLMGVFLQVNGPVALVDRSVEKALDITDEQRDKLHELLAPPRDGRGEGRGEGRGAGKGEGRGEGKGAGEAGAGSFRERREKMEKDAMAVLTSDQQKKLKDLKGEKIDIDMSKLRGPGGGREGRGRDRGNRGEPKASKSSS
jgi:Spy/CpxP family protein refolding chaperone